MILNMPTDFMNRALLLHVGVVLVSLYLVFASRRFPVATSEVAAGELSVG